MSMQIEMPELSADGEGATLATWLVSVGDRVEKGDVIAELETDKSTVELEAPTTGTIVRFDVAEGTEDISPGVVLALLEPEDPASVDEASVDEMVPEPSHASTPRSVDPETATATMDEGLPVSSTTHDPSDESLRTATPLARRAALDRDVDVSTLTGTGPGGRVVEDDVLRSVDSGPIASRSLPAPSETSTASESVPLSAMRKTIARRMTESKQQVPHFYLRQRCSMDALLDARAELNRELAAAGRELKISVNDFVLRASALALRAVPDANVSFAGTHMEVFDRVDICVAVATDGGLVTPVIRDADRKGLATLAAEVRELALLAREGKLRPEQYQGGSFTISNLGMYGVETVYPILNPPQACILGVGASSEEPIVRDGAVGIGHIAAFTLAADHRVVDGAVGARLLAALRERLEDPLSMLL
jgi:pyruvate dehydrogenase E2 component (dihydrolipoamide acetyltransferase)